MIKIFYFLFMCSTYFFNIIELIRIIYDDFSIGKAYCQFISIFIKLHACTAAKGKFFDKVY